MASTRLLDEKDLNPIVGKVRTRRRKAAWLRHVFPISREWSDLQQEIEIKETALSGIMASECL